MWMSEDIDVLALLVFPVLDWLVQPRDLRDGRKLRYAVAFWHGQTLESPFVGRWSAWSRHA
jgi:hypothetical protein